MKMRNRFALFLAMAALLVALPVMAQEQVGGIDGVVKDAEGSVLPGVTVEATSGSIGTVVATTDQAGRYRFPRLPSGVYTVKGSLEGYKPAEVKGINLSLGQMLTVNLALEVGTFEETIVVTGEGTQIDVTQSAAATSISREQIDLIPKGRDFTTVATQAPGASNEAFAGGISIDGSSGSENRFVIDGIDTTDPQTGVSAQNLITDFVEEVQVKSAGYAAEFGGSTGGVVNVVTKSGTNEFQGSVGVYYSSNDLGQGDVRPTPRRDSLALCGSSSLYCTFNEDDTTVLEPGFSLSGPIARDKAWFFVAYQPQITDTDRHPLRSSTFSASRTNHFFAGNLKGNVGSKFLYKVNANLSPSEVEDGLPALDGSTPAVADLDFTSDFDANSYSAYGDYIASSSFYFSGRLGYFITDQHDSGTVQGDRFSFTPNGTPAAIGAGLQRPPGFDSAPVGHLATNQDRYERQAAAIDASYFLDAAGSHSFKAGVQYEEITNKLDEGEARNLYLVRWGLPDRFGVGAFGTFGSLEVRSFQRSGDVTSENVGLFLQDSWQIRPNFTLNVGVRTEQEQVPNYNSSLPNKYPIKFDFGDKVAPRVGFAWDVLSDQRWKAYGSWGTYYDITKLEMPRGAFGGDKWISHFYGIANGNWPGWQCDQVNNNSVQGANGPCSNVGDYFGSLDLRHPSSDPNDPFGIEPNLEPMEQEELQIGLDHQLTQNSVLGVRYVNKELKQTIEDIGARIVLPDGSSAEVYTQGNPGSGLFADDPPGPQPRMPKARRDYEAIELSWNRRFADNWSARVGYTHSSLEGNYSGLASSDEFGRTSPNVERFFDLLHNAFNETGAAEYGPLNTDRPNAVDAQLVYRAPWGTTLGVSQFWADGTPISEEVSYAGVPFFPKGRENRGRTPDLSQTDLLVSHPFKIGDYTIEASINVLNLLDEDTVTRVFNFPYDVTLNSPLFARCGFGTVTTDVEDCFFLAAPFDTDALQAGRTKNAQFLKPQTFQAPRTVRFGLKFAF